jgi:hypothetical protein
LKSHHIYVCFYAGVGVAGTVTAGAISGVVGYIAADNDCLIFSFLNAFNIDKTCHISYLTGIYFCFYFQDLNSNFI